MAAFQHFPLTLLKPDFDSELVDILNELEILRHFNPRLEVHPHIFSQIKDIFHILESLGSARIEGNHTTLADYVDDRLLDNTSSSEALDEIHNIEKAMHFIEDNFHPNDKISEHFIRELHAMTVHHLTHEGDKTPGQYRNHPVAIAQSAHTPPDAIHVPMYMQELVDFINQADKPKYDLMKIALAHHRFGWIHPFGNGNGRTVRLLTYALLIKYGFNVQTGGRVLNPTAVFCTDRNRYYEMLGIADLGTTQGLEQWCCYVLAGILQELKKVDQLTRNDFLNPRILMPALQFSLTRQYITQEEVKILTMMIEQGTLKAGDLKILFPHLTANQRTYQIKKLLDQKIILPQENNARIYIPNFAQSYLVRGIIEALRNEGFIGGLD